MNRQVVYYRPNEDITTPVLESLNKKFSPDKKDAPQEAKAPRGTPKN